MQIQEGEGWRLILDPRRRPFQALVGGRDWATELREMELQALIRGVSTLLEQHRQLQTCLMAEEEITLELDLPLTPDDGAPGAGREHGDGSLHLALEGDARQWALRFVLTPSEGVRGIEGGWSAAASLPLAAALLALEAENGRPAPDGSAVPPAGARQMPGWP
ncbi:MAG: DUF1818 family protein [Cyanobium sp.]